MNQKTFSKRLRLRLDELNMNQSEFARLCGMAPAMVTDYLKERYMPKKNRLAVMAKVLRVSEEWLAGESDDKSRESSLSHAAVDAGIASRSPVRIPVVSKIAAGVPMEAMESHIDDDDPDTWEEIPGEWMHGDKAFFALKVSGDSMSPDIPDGSIAIIERCYEWHDGKVMAVYVNGYNATLKRVKLKDGGIVLLEAFNPSYETQMYTAEEVEDTPVKPCGILIETRKKW